MYTDLDETLKKDLEVNRYIEPCSKKTFTEQESMYKNKNEIKRATKQNYTKKRKLKETKNRESYVVQ